MKQNSSVSIGLVVLVLITLLAVIMRNVDLPSPQETGDAEAPTLDDLKSLLPSDADDAQRIQEIEESPLGTIVDRGEADYVEGRAVRCGDGDSFDLLIGGHSNQKRTVRLHGVDAPELHQERGKEAQRALEALVKNKDVKLLVLERDRHGRLVAVAHTGETHVNLALVARGWAWHYRRHNQSEILFEAEELAKENELGIWQDENPEMPWRWRRDNPRTD